MASFENKTNGNGSNGSLLRRFHRWLGVVLALFILLLSLTGIALNHSDGWDLDSNYISSNWLLDAYGVRAPAVSASFTHGDRRATLLGKRLYLDEREIADDTESLTGIVVLDDLILVATRDRALVLTVDGERVEQMDLSAVFPGAIGRIGSAGSLAAVSSEGTVFLSDADISGFVPGTDIPDIAWAQSSAVPDALLTALQGHYRGRGLSIERVIADIHSGRIVTITGPYLMDAVAILLIILSITGVVMWLRPRKKKQ
jgi:uncharacterized iron-regulated membrane protein